MASFYDLSDEERGELTREAVRQRRTLVERWRHLASERTKTWSHRSETAASWLGGVESVADLGCGGQQLEVALRPGTVYLPVDVVARDERTICVDLNQQSLPSLGTHAVAALGLLEYVFDVPTLLAQMAVQFSEAVISYNISDAPKAHVAREKHGWVNAYSRKELEALFAQARFGIVRSEMIDPRQMLWLLAGSAPRSLVLPG